MNDLNTLCHIRGTKQTARKNILQKVLDQDPSLGGEKARVRSSRADAHSYRLEVSLAAAFIGRPRRIAIDAGVFSAAIEANSDPGSDATGPIAGVRGISNLSSRLSMSS